MKESQASGPEILNSAIRRALLIEAQRQPKLPDDIHAVWVFSGPGTYFTALKDKEESWQTFMDRDRIHAGLRLYRLLTAKRIEDRTHQETLPAQISFEDLEQYGPYFIYNGNPAQNRDFAEAWAKGFIKLPKQKLIILDEVEAPNASRPIANTLDQVASFYQEKARENSPLFRCHRIALVSHSPHFVRIPHYIRRFEEEFLQSHGRVISYWAWAVKSESAVFNEFVRSELNKLASYVNRGHLNPAPTPHLTIA